MTTLSVPTVMAVSSLVTFVIAGVYLALLGCPLPDRRRRAFRSLALAFGCCGSSLACQVVTTRESPWPCVTLEVLFHVGWVTALWWGVRSHDRARENPPGVLAVPAALVTWVLLVQAIGLPQAWQTVPPHFVGAALLSLAGMHIWLLHRPRGTWPPLVLAVTLWTCGADTAWHPFARATSYEVYDCLAFAVLAPAVGIGLMASALLDDRSELLCGMDAMNQVERELRESQELYQSLLVASPDAIGVITQEGSIVFASRRMNELLHLPPDHDLQGSPALDWISPEDRARAAELLSTTAAGTAIVSAPFRLTRADGQALNVEISGGATPAFPNRPAKIVTIVRDATNLATTEAAIQESRAALHKREAELNESQRLAHIGSFDWDSVNDTIWWSDEYFRIYGLDPQRPTPNYAHHLEVYTPESVERLDTAVNRLLQTGEPYELDLELGQPTPSTQWIVVRGEARRDTQGRISGIRGTAQDITERKRTERKIEEAIEELEKGVRKRTLDLQEKSVELQENQMALMNIVEDLNEKTSELEEANLKLKELDQLKSMFIASMSHELRTPLNSIIGFSSIMLNEWTGPLTDEQKENMGAVLRSGKHLLSVINDIIDVSKIEAGKIESIVEDFDVRDVIMEAVETLRREIDRKRLTLAVQAPRQVLHADRRRLLQSILNLVSNAVKYTAQGSIEVRAQVSEDGAVLTLEVEDTGIGIREEELDKLFLPFVRIHSPMQATIPGTGLGLYLTKKLVQELLKGDIQVTSTYGSGSRFTLRVPVAG